MVKSSLTCLFLSSGRFQLPKHLINKPSEEIPRDENDNNPKEKDLQSCVRGIPNYIQSV